MPERNRHIKTEYEASPILVQEFGARWMPDQIADKYFEYREKLQRIGQEAQSRDQVFAVIGRLGHLFNKLLSSGVTIIDDKGIYAYGHEDAEAECAAWVSYASRHPNEAPIVVEHLQTGYEQFHVTAGRRAVEQILSRVQSVEKGSSTETPQTRIHMAS